jgi:hypothetical protein
MLMSPLHLFTILLAIAASLPVTLALPPAGSQQSPPNQATATPAVQPKPQTQTPHPIF